MVMVQSKEREKVQTLAVNDTHFEILQQGALAAGMSIEDFLIEVVEDFKVAQAKRPNLTPLPPRQKYKVN